MTELLTPDDEAALYSVCVHEATHDLVCAMFNLPSATHVVSPDAGVCVHRDGGPFANAVIGISGVIGEVLLNAPHKGREYPSVPLTAESIFEWASELKVHFLSQQDRDSINGYSNIFDPARAAFEILSRNLDRLEALAASLANRSREKFIQAKNRDPQINEQELEKFIHQWSAEQRERQAERNLQAAIRQGDEILASLPPCRIPAAFNLSTFMANTAASELEISDFIRYRTERECWQSGRAVGAEEVRIAETFFKNEGLSNRDRWVYAAKQLFDWREQNKRERSS